MAAAAHGQSHGSRPNILWILTEDMSPQLGCYGEPLIQTPNLDRLAAEGALFRHAFTTAPVCSASRSALATGMYQTAIGSHNHRTIHKKPLPTPVRHFCEYLRDAGYYTVLSAPAPGMRQPGGGTGAAGSGKTDYNFTVEKPFDGRDWSTRAPGQPFFAQLTIQESHKGVGWPLGRKLTPRIDPAKLVLPPYYPDHPIARDEYANYLEAIQLVDVYVGDVLARLKKEGLDENTIVILMGDNGSCTYRGKQFLYEGGIRVPLVVRWPGRLKPGTVREDLISGVDVTAAVLAAAGVPLPAHLHGRDFLARNAQPREHIFAARDRCDIATERLRCVRDGRYKYIRNYLPAIPYMQANPYKEKEYPTWNLVRDLHRAGKLNPVQSQFVADSKPVEELYDLQSDPHEVRNLAAEDQHASRLRSMRTLLENWIAETHDQGAIMEDPVEIHQNYFKRA
ncbi:MAG TPA: sulfatase [Bryobacteraceae bacterium]|nr:sulfatase [Bryobacteraceae bacterium]